MKKDYLTVLIGLAWALVVLVTLVVTVLAGVLIISLLFKGIPWVWSL